VVDIVFTFFVPIPGIKADYHEVDFDNLYPKEEIVDLDEAMHALLEDLVYSQQVWKTGWVKGVGRDTRAKPRYNLTGDPYFTFGLRAVLEFDRRPVSFMELQSFNWEKSPTSTKLKRLTIDQQQDFD
jgi:hypothetical protein